MSSAALLTDLQSYAKSIIDQYQIPAVSLGVWHNNKCYQAAAGILNVTTGVEANTESIFQIGSITKVFTTCLVMQLVDEGSINLDAPVKTYLRDFQIADTEATHIITVRQLLNHTNGIAGDYFSNDTYEQGNAITRYLDRINLIPLVHPPGTQYSYSNAAFGVAGRLIEVILGYSWYQAVEERIFKPLGMTQAIADPKETLRYRAAMGHVAVPGKVIEWKLSPSCYSTLGMGLAPAGTTLTMTAADLISFARAHLNENKASAKNNWLSPASIQLMQTPSVQLPPSSEIFNRHWGLGWGILTDKRSDTKIVWHVGEVAGQNSMLQLFPHQDTAVVVLLNSARPSVLNNIMNDLVSSLVGIDSREPEPNPMALTQGELTAYTGIFDSFDALYKVDLALNSLKNDTPSLLITRTDKLHKSTSQLSWLPLGNNIFASFTSQGARLSNVVYIKNDNDSDLSLLLVGGRLNHRISPPNDK